ncbi:MAG: AEC family transporter [Pseudomonadota bacterium]
MSEFLSLLTTATLPIFAVSAVGFALARTGRVTAQDAEGVNLFALRVAVPALVFRLLAEADVAAFDWPVLLAYLAAEILVYALTFALCRYGLGIERREALLLGMAAIFVNGVFFVLPIAEILYGPAAEQVITGIVVLDSTLIFGGTIFLCDLLGRGEAGVGRVMARFAGNPMIIGMALGLALSVTGLTMPQGIATYVGFVGDAAAPAALFALGVILAKAKLAEGRRAVPLVIAMKMLGQPLATFLLIGALASPGLWSQTAFLFTAGPAGAMPFVIALGYGIRTERIALVVIVTTVISLISLPGAALLAG